MIGVLYTKTGMVIGKLTEIASIDSDTVIGYEIENPCQLHLTQENMMLFPLLAAVVENSVSISVRELQYDNVFTPEKSVLTEYNKMFSRILLPT